MLTWIIDIVVFYWLKYVDLYHPWVSLNCFIQKYVDLNHWHSYVFLILKSMLTCITHGYHWITSSKSMLTWITDIVVFSWFCKVCWLDEVCWLAAPMYVPDLMKYVDLHHPCVFQILWSMLTCITQVCSGSYEVWWLPSTMCVLYLIKYADLHHPCVLLFLWVWWHASPTRWHMKLVTWIALTMTHEFGF